MFLSNPVYPVQQHRFLHNGPRRQNSQATKPTGKHDARTLDMDELVTKLNTDQILQNVGYRTLHDKLSVCVMLLHWCAEGL